MDGIREWIMQIAGVIVLGTLCDMILAESEIKKYVKPILGFVLIFTVVSPISNMAPQKINMDFLEDESQGFLDVAERSDKLQAETMATLYEEKLSLELSRSIGEAFKKDVKVLVSAENKEGKIGEIDGVVLEISAEEGEVVNCEEIRKYTAKALGVDKNKVKAQLKIVEGESPQA
ncbi:MAG: stage III sporulation protein AF [Clostridia bacterium]|nr:stage III sporulation protein AF [Clostridia bacterium]